jgi:hypothetical protein
VSEAAPISPYWEHFNIGMYTRVVDNDRVKGQIVVLDQYPDGRRFRVLLQILDVEEIKNHVCQVD